jgi:formate hydrogenlyase transcriptional activator
MSGTSPHFPQSPGSHTMFEKLFEASPDAIVVTDAEGRITSINSQVERLFGYGRQQLIGESVEILVPERFRKAHPGHRGAYNAHASVRPMGAGLELFGRRRDGSEFPVDIMLSPMETAKGRVVISVIRDISDRKKAQEAIQRSEAQFRALFEFSPDAIIASDQEGRITEVNPRVESMFGYKRGELTGQSIDILVPERFRQTHPARRQEYAAAARVRPMGAGLELYGRRKDGSEFPVDIMLSPMETAENRVIISVIRDISERKKAQEAIHRSEAQFRALFEFSPDAIIASDREGRITEVNARVESMFGYKRGELTGQSIDILVPERFRHTHPARRKDYASAARVRPMGAGLELYGRRKDGSEFPADIMLGPVETANGRVVLSVIRDLTEKREAEEALRRSELQKRYLEEELNTEARFEEIIGESIGLKRVLKLVETVSATDVTVLILGETGTGKEVIARAIHQLSPRNEHVMVKLNCAAIPAGLLESELFGHERGAFTGAVDRKIGRLELAHEGTLFLDEIGDLPLELQPKILRALQEKEFERLGSNKPIPVNVRLVAATNRDLAKMVAEGQFRSDLYYRLRVFPILLPPLRERREDIPLLVRYFVDRHARKLYKKIETIPEETMRALTRWDWPGNIRELENFIERAVILTRGPVLRAPLGELEMPEEASQVEDSSLEAKEREHILRVLRETKGKIGGSDGAAARLGLIRTTLNSKLKKLGIVRKDYI